jgi:hypothetical protein
MQLSDCLQGSIVSVINSEGGSSPNSEENPRGSVYFPHVRGFSGKLKRIGSRYSIGMIFKTKHQIWSSSVKSGRNEICNRRHSASIVLLVYVREAILAKLVESSCALLELRQNIREGLLNKQNDTRRLLVHKRTRPTERPPRPSANYSAYFCEWIDVE